jgi:hypothetical protein
VEFKSESIWAWVFLHWEVCFVFVFFITVSVLLLVIDLLRLLMFSWFNFDGSYVSRNLCISSWFSTLLDYRFSKYPHMIFWMSLVYIVTPSFSHLILLIWVFSICLLVHLAEGLSILLIFSENQFLCCDLCIYWSKFFFYFLSWAENHCSNKVNNSATNQVFEWVRKNWNPYLTPQ